MDQNPSTLGTLNSWLMDGYSRSYMVISSASTHPNVFSMDEVVSAQGRGLGWVTFFQAQTSPSNDCQFVVVFLGKSKPETQSMFPSFTNPLILG